MLKRLLAYCFLLALILASSFLYAKKTPTTTTPPVFVEKTQATLETWQDTLQTVGSLSANQGIIIKPEISGRITAVYFRSGDIVKAHDPLVQLNPDILKAQLDATTAQAQLSIADYKRGLILYKKKVLAKAELDKLLAIYQADQAKQAQAQAALNQTLIRAPFSGRIGLRMVDQGDTIDPSQPIANLNAIDPLRVDFKIPETASSKVRIGNKVWIHTSTYPNKTFVGTIYALDSQIDINTRSLGVRASLSNPQQQLLPGAFVDIRMAIDTPQTLVTIPETAVSTDENGPYVYRIENNKAIKAPVTIRFHRDGSIALSAGLQAGDAIISIGGFKVANNTPVIIGK